MKLLSLLILIEVYVGSVAVHAGNAPAVATLDWIDRPWEYRYLLYVDAADDFWVASKRQGNLELDGPKGPSSINMPGPFTPTWTLQGQASENGLIPGKKFEVLRIDVRRDRAVVTQNQWGIPLDARLNWYEDLVLVPRMDKPEKVVRFGRFFMGSYAASDVRYSPAICSRTFGDNVDPREQSGRYVEKNFDPISDGYFGCREWAAQLYDSRRPYIDVTSYEYAIDYDKPKLTSGPRKGDYPLKQPLTFAPEIKHFIGFSRFDDPPKPIIGNHEGQWLCLNDCPGGEAPGKIADIKAWVALRGWPVPQSPKDVREYMDKEVRTGELVD